MTRGAVLRLFSVLAVCSQGLTAVIQTQQTVLAAVGEEARFSCQLLVSKDVLQVTWQKLLPDREENLATYSKYFGQRVNPDFTDNVEFKNIGLQNCSIVIRNVTDQDEGCYYCLFNTYPEGSFRGRTCLQVYELHDPVLHMRESNSTAELTVSCSATGRPAPTVTLSVSQQDLSFSHNNTVSVSNTNGTFTVTTTAVLSGSHENRTQVGCAVRVLFAPQKEAFLMLPEVKQMSDDVGLTAVIQTQQTVLAAVGEEACFSCQLLVSKDVLQVTWQKLLPDREENLATYSKYFGRRVNPDFTDNVEFKNIGLQNCSIVIRNVTDQDEGCYYCLFNTYPEGSFRGRTCLQVYELHDPVLHMRESNSTAELTVSCSATGRPAPTVTFSVSQQDLNFSHKNTVSVSNTNGTFTVTTTAVLSGSRKNSAQVGCAVRVLSAPQKEAFLMLPEVKQMSDDVDFPWIILLVVVPVIAHVLVTCGWVITPRLKQQKKKRDPEENTTETQKNSDRDMTGTHTPLIKENETIRQ